LTFEWQPPVDNGGSPLTAYYIYQAIGNSAFSKVSDAPAENNPSITINTEDNLSPA